MKNLERRVRLLSIYAVMTSFIMFITVLTSFSKKERIEKFDEITVKRINIIEEDGSLRMVLSNKNRQHSGRMNGKDWDKRERQAGLLFFNDESDECGGLIYSSKIKDGNTISGMSITMDKYKDDQVVQILNSEVYKNGKSMFERGLKINDYPEGTSIDSRLTAIAEINKISDIKIKNEKMNNLMNQFGSKNRLFLGQTKGNSSGLFLSDKNGNPKMMIYVDPDGNPKIETFNDKGESTNFLK